MITLAEAKEQLLTQIEVELCRIYDANSKAPAKLQEFYDHITELSSSNFIFAWYRKNAGKVQIRYIGDEVCIYTAEHADESPSGYIVGIDGPDALDELTDQALGNEN